MVEETQKTVPIGKGEDITEELSCLRNHKFIAWGAGQFWGKIFIHFVENLQLTLLGFCDNNPDLWGTEYEGYLVFSPEQFVAMVKEEENLMVQVTVDQQYEEAVYEQLKGFGAAHIILGMTRDNKLNYYRRLLISQFMNIYNLPKEQWHESYQKEIMVHYQNSVAVKKKIDDQKETILVCHLPKTGDHTLLKTFQKEKIPAILCQHNPNMLKGTSGKKKVTMAIREPIIRDLSHIFQEISTGQILLFGVSFDMLNEAINKGEYQKCFQNYFNIHKNLTSAFFQNCAQSGVDVLSHPFDKENGYSIIKTGNFDVFFYQLEKLNNLIPELSAWTGTHFTELVNSNAASDKWVADSYKKAQKTMKLTQEYFDQCYNDPYVQHCYSQEDIEKFKDRWRGNIQ